jgi:hypothetical protein
MQMASFRGIPLSRWKEGLVLPDPAVVEIGGIARGVLVNPVNQVNLRWGEKEQPERRAKYNHLKSASATRDIA